MTEIPEGRRRMTAYRLARLSAVTLMLASLGALSGCTLPFQDPEPAEPTMNLERAGRMLTQSDTNQALPMGSNMPAGYAVAPGNLLQPTRSGTEVVRPARCQPLYDGIDVDYVKSRTKSFVTYVNSDQAFVGVGVSSRRGSLVGLADSAKLLGSCPRFTVSQGGETMRITSAPLPFPKVGERSFAARFTLRGTSAPATYDAVRIQAGHNTVLVDAMTTKQVLPSSAEMEDAATVVLLNLSR